MSSVLTESSERIGLTWEEYLALPDETRNTDLVDGMLVMNSPNFEHELVVRRLMVEILAWRRLHAPRCGTVGTQQPIKVSARRGYQPALAWYPAASCTWADDGSVAVSGLPSIVVEVLSPSTRGIDLVRKRGDYERLGIAEYWILDPRDRSAFCLRRATISATFDDVELAAHQLLRSVELPGFEVEVGRLFIDE